MADSIARPRSLANVLPPLAGIGLAAIGSGLLHTLLPLRLQAQGCSANAIGMVVTGYSVGFLAGCLGMPVLIRSVGHVRANAAFAATAALTILALDWIGPLWLTAALLTTTGIAAAGLSIVTESWLNELVPPAWRARVLTAYVLEIALCYGLGQLIGLDVDVAGSRMPILSAGFYICALIPVAAIDVAGPKPPETARLHLLHAFRVSPVGALSCVVTGLVTATFSGIGPLYGAGLGLGQKSIVALMAAMQLGGLALQWPLGFLSDRYDRRYLMAAMSGAIMALSAILIVFERLLPFPALAIVLGCFAGISESFYPIGVAHSNDRADPSEYVSLSSNLLLLWGVGGAIGPIVATRALGLVGPSGFFWYVLILATAFGAYALWRTRRAATVADDMREEFVVYPTTSPAIFEWIPFRKLRGSRRKPGSADS
jgi:MFS family permease